MPYKRYELPAFPCKADMWDELKSSNRPLIIYGMGNGADKLIERLKKYGLEPSDIFASDGFVRGHSFHGMRVKSFSQICELYDDFIILVSFATKREEVIGLIKEYSDRYDVYIPDMPIAKEEYFDRELYNQHYEEIAEAYNTLSDEYSRSLYCAVLHYKLTGRIEYLLPLCSDTEEIYRMLPEEKIEGYIDVGAYNGDTVKEALKYLSNLKYITAVEPDRKNFKRLEKTVQKEGIEACLKNAAAWCEDTDGSFSSSGNRNSTAVATASHEHTSELVKFRKIDSIAKHRVDLLKYDVEGAEYEALVGSEQTITKNKPCILVSLYHRSEDIYALINYLRAKYRDYDFYLRRTLCIPAWELNLIMLPRGEKKK